jgi:uncharacterized protein (DUF305 family)
MQSCKRSNLFSRLALAGILGAAGASTIAAAPASAQAPHAGMNMPANAATPATAALQAADAAMMQGMDAPYTGDADADFVAHMIPHHRGAVAMAQVELKYGKDPKLRKLARDIVRAQDAEIRFMREWQRVHGVR